MRVYFAKLAIARAIGGVPWKPKPGGYRILVTGTFFSENWVSAHIRPLAAAAECEQLYVVSTYPLPDSPKGVAVYPPNWLKKMIGGVPARLLVFLITAMRTRPHLVGGFHLLVNALVANVTARLIGARSMYFCVGGPMEVLDGGIWAENRLFGTMETPDPVVERQLLRAVNTFDQVITMGTRAVEYHRRHGANTRFDVISGGMNPATFFPGDEPPTTDLVLVGRLTEIKRIDVFLRGVRHAVQRCPSLSATIVVDGDLRESLEQDAKALGIADHVRFVGQQSNVADWLRKSRIFVLTSDSEGLALSLMEAMSCGLPAIVTNVGDLPDLIEDGVNGYLVPRRDAEALGERIVELLNDEQRLGRFSKAAREAAMYHETSRVSGRWDQILKALRGSHANGGTQS